MRSPQATTRESPRAATKSLCATTETQHSQKNDLTLEWSGQWHPTLVLLPGKSHGRRRLVGCSPCGHKESDTAEWLTLSLNWINITNIYKKLHPTPVQYLYIYIHIHIIFQKIYNIYEDKNMLGHREIHKFKSIFSHHIGVELEINKKNTQAFTNIYKLKSMSK